MPKLLVITEVFYPEEFLVNDLVAEWSKQGLEMEVLTKTPSYPFGKTYQGYKNKWHTQTTEMGLKVHRVRIVEGYENSVVRKIANYLVNALAASVVALRIGKRFDTVFIYQTGPLTFALPGALIHKFYKKKTVIWSQDLWPDTVFSYGFKDTKFNRNILNAFVRFIYRQMDVALVTSRGFIKSLQVTTKGLKEFIYVPQWPMVKAAVVDVEPPENWDPNLLHFTFTGNVGKVQNLDHVIEGFAMVSEKWPGKCRLNIVGDGSHLASLKNKVEEGNIRDVVFHGRKPLDQMQRYYSASDILVISLDNDPSFNKYIPAKFQSYLTCGKPIFAAIDGEVKNLVEEYDLGWTAKPGDVAHIAEKFDAILHAGKSERKKKGINAKYLLDNQFDREHIISEITKYCC